MRPIIIIENIILVLRYRRFSGMYYIKICTINSNNHYGKNKNRFGIFYLQQENEERLFPNSGLGFGFPPFQQPTNNLVSIICTHITNFILQLGIKLQAIGVRCYPSFIVPSLKLADPTPNVP